jgi:predicted aspartyl protease
MLKTGFQFKPTAEFMGKIIVNVVVSNISNDQNKISFDALVDTGATFLTLPSIWKTKLGDLEVLEEVELELATGEIASGEICGPVRIKIGEFRTIIGEVLFMKMEADCDGNYEPLISYLPLAAIPAGVDMLNHRLFKVKAIVK